MSTERVGARPAPVRTPRTRRGVAAASLVLLALGLAAAACGRSTAGADDVRSSPRRAKVVASPVETRSLDYTVPATGALEAYQVLDVPARVAGVIGEISFDVGQQVTPKDVLAVVDRERHLLTVREAEAGVAAAAATASRAAAQKTSAEASLKEAQANLNRREALRGRVPGAVTVEEIETSRAAVERLGASVAEAVAQGEEAAAAEAKARAAVDIARRDAEDAEIHPPLAGIVERRHVSEGQYVHPGDPVATLVDRSILRLRFRVSERDSVRLEKSMAVHFRVAAFPERSFGANLVHVEGTADPVTRMVECLADVADPPAELKPGFFAQVTVDVGGSVHAVVIPDRAIRATEDGYVAFVIEGGKAHQRKLELGLRTADGHAEVLHGLAAGEQLVIEGAGALEEGTAVEIVPPEAAGEPTKAPKVTGAAD